MTIYMERANGQNEYWTYTDGSRVYISKRTADKEISRGARLVKVK